MGQDNKSKATFYDTAAQLAAARKYFIAQGILSSDSGGADNEAVEMPFASFHIYDPDGNRMNFGFYGGD